jgi:1-acyl-sn-glycerol-3-phosphate acyltransferase
MRRTLDRIWRVLFTGSAFLGFFSLAVLLSYLVLPLVAVATRDRVLRARRCRKVVATVWIYFHDYMRITRLLRYDARPHRERVSVPGGPHVIVANHPTLVDVTALLSTLPDGVVVVKRALMRSPLVGPILRFCRHIDAGDGGAFAGVAVYEQAMQHLREGTPVLLFPEGTRSPERGLGEFRLGAFQIACRAGVPLVQLLLRCEPPTLMRGQAWYEIPERTAELSLAQLPIIEPSGAKPGQLCHAVRDTYLRCLGLDEQATTTPAPASSLAVASGA